MSPELLWPAALSLLLVVGAIGDIRERRLPNWLSLAVLVLGLAYAFSMGGLPALGWHGAHAAIALVIGMVLYALGIVGGGDVKFYAGLAAYFALEQGLFLLISVTLFGGVAVLGWIITRRLIRGKPKDKSHLHTKYPYGVAIAGGGLWLLWGSLITA